MSPSNARENSNRRKTSGKREVTISTTINSTNFEVTVAAKCTLAELLRDKLNLTGTKLGCNRAECGVCTVLLDGTPVFSCTVLAYEANHRKVETVEGLARNGSLHILQEAFIRNDALQCGFCTPGLLMSLKALLDKRKEVTLEDVKESVSGNYCRCGAYPGIFNAAIEAAKANLQTQAEKHPEPRLVPEEIRTNR
jgi:xanthine dehydrogenase YagT iron-sulfur-binding subunit